MSRTYPEVGTESSGRQGQTHCVLANKTGELMYTLFIHTHCIEAPRLSLQGSSVTKRQKAFPLPLRVPHCPRVKGFVQVRPQLPPPPCSRVPLLRVPCSLSVRQHETSLLISSMGSSVGSLLPGLDQTPDTQEAPEWTLA
jgi:hypothetical protein